jgi:hypothetical protein
LPTTAPAGTAQQLSGGGWSVSYRVDVDDGAAVLTYFASHRMTDDALHRIDAEGRVETVDVVQFLFRADDPAAEKEYYEHNRRFYEEVDRLGLGGAPQ